MRGRGEGSYADAIHALFEAAATRHGFRRGAIPSDVQVDAQDAGKTCMSIAMPAAMTAAEPEVLAQPPVAEKPPVPRTGQLELRLT